ncbi:hypothetical protein I350_05341 [Cryptococcus amylolentus CBS 6273]|uniref:BZIP domain-containing protein n=1 Tax=Cryptococcus amylolentus CBS 6273 TaxID=1296118 RepID=A0A1E3JV73_9TREE|nr:hypothetical protein I350_05341 [Cryptococcus amylolentus CBS 6273]
MAALQTQTLEDTLAIPTWGSYLYQNYLQAPSPDTVFDWTDPSVAMPPPPAPEEYAFGLTNPSVWPSASGQSPKSVKPEPVSPAEDPSLRQLQDVYKQSYFPFPATGIATSLLTQPDTPASALPAQLGSTESLNVVDQSLTRSPSPISSQIVSPHASPILRHSSTKRETRGRRRIGSAAIKRSHSLHSDSEFSHHSPDEHDHDEHEHEVPEGVERDGMIWGMKVEDYRALSARERKRVRNRISARTFRAKRKEHLSSLEHDLGEKEHQIQLANAENARLRRELSDGKLFHY